MGRPLPVLLKSCGRAGWVEEAFFPPFLLPFCSSVMEEIQGSMQQDLKLQSSYFILQKKKK